MSLPGFFEGDTQGSAGASGSGWFDKLGASMEPATTSALISAGSKVLGSALTPKPDGPTSQAVRNFFESPFDGSGWTVNFGNGNTGAADSRTQSRSASESQAGAVSYLPWVIAALGVAIVYKLVRG